MTERTGSSRSDKTQRMEVALDYLALGLENIVIFRNQDVMAVNKPAGIATTGGRSVYRVGLTETLRRLTGSGEVSPAHRLDVETSGAILFGLTALGRRALAVQFQTGEVEKYYVALVEGSLNGPAGVNILMANGQATTDADPSGKPSESVILPIAKYTHGEQTCTLIRVIPKTGRLHQIRAHTALLQIPIVGDRAYGSTVAYERPLLHCRQLTFALPGTDRRETVTADLPQDMVSFLQNLKLQAVIDQQTFSRLEIS